MLSIQNILLQEHSREERLPDFDPAFPYIATRAELDRYTVPWHWHPAVELFFMESGTLEYTTPGGTWIFPPGSGAFVNSNILHRSQVRPSGEAAIQRLHLFDPVLLSGGYGTRMEEKYILPLTNSGIEILPLYPSDPLHQQILEQIQHIFTIQSRDSGYEFYVREALCAIWLQLLELSHRSDIPRTGTDKQIKALMIYIHEHYSETINVQQLSQYAHISTRTCFRLFQEKLHMSPVEYIRSYRLRQACRMLAATDIPITQIGYACGLGTASYFGKVFHTAYGCTPAQYRRMARS